MRREGVAPVEVAPSAVPLPDRTVRPGAGTAVDGAGGRWTGSELRVRCEGRAAWAGGLF